MSSLYRIRYKPDTHKGFIAHDGPLSGREASVYIAENYARQREIYGKTVGVYTREEVLVFRVGR